MDDKKWKNYLQWENLSKKGHGLSIQARETELNIAFSNLNIKVEKALDIGCEEGIIMEAIKKAFNCETIGISANKNEAKSNKNIIVADMHELPFKDEEFDLVTIMSTLEHSIAPYIVLQEIQRVLKQNGYIFIEMPEEGDLWTTVPDHFSVMTFRQIFNLLYKCGFLPIKNFRFYYDVSALERRRCICCLWKKTNETQSIISNEQISLIPVVTKRLINTNKGFQILIIDCCIIKESNMQLGRTDSLKLGDLCNFE